MTANIPACQYCADTDRRRPAYAFAVNRTRDFDRGPVCICCFDARGGKDAYYFTHIYYGPAAGDVSQAEREAPSAEGLRNVRAANAVSDEEVNRWAKGIVSARPAVTSEKESDR